MENFEKYNNLSEEQQERQEKFAELLGIIDSLSLNLNSTITSDFVEYLVENNLNFKDYFLANVFLSRISHKELPESSDYKFYDTEDGKIEGFINGLAENLQEKAA